jgi:mRNA interferase MazF
LNRIRIGTVVCVPLTSNLKWAAAPGNVILSSCVTGLAKESVANVSQLVTVDKAQLTERVGKLPTAKLEVILDGIHVVLGRLIPGGSWTDRHRRPADQRASTRMSGSVVGAMS